MRRLQAVDREPGAAIVIDEATWEKAGALAHSFEPRHDVEIRGRSDRLNVYSLLPNTA